MVDKCKQCMVKDFINAGKAFNVDPDLFATYAVPPHDEGYGKGYASILDQIDKTIQDTLVGTTVDIDLGKMRVAFVCEICGEGRFEDKGRVMRDKKLTRYICCGTAVEGRIVA